MENANNDALAASAESGQPETPKKTKTKAAKPSKAKVSKTKPTAPKLSDSPAGELVPDPMSAANAEPEPNIPAATGKKSMEQITSQIYREAAERIVALMDAGNSIWQKPWVAAPGHSRPYSAASGLPFYGFNRFSLMSEMLANGWADARFMTYRQVQTMAANMAKEGTKAEDLPYVRAGARGLPIYKYGFVEKKVPVLDAAGRPRMDAEGNLIVNIVRGKSYLRSYVVFPASAIANLPSLPAVEPLPKWEIRSQVEDLIEKMGVPVKHEPGNRAYYSITSDTITMPERGQFRDSVDGRSGQFTEAASDKYLSVLLHEMSHATGAKHRIGRAMSGVHGTPSYSREELTAESAACYLMAETSLSSGSTSSESIARTAAYLSSWRQAILDDPKALMTAFTEAEKAADWVMQRHPIQLEAAAKLAAEGQIIGFGHGSELRAVQTRDVAEPAHAIWPMPVNTMQGSGQSLGLMP